MKALAGKIESLVKLVQRIESEPKHWGTDVLLTGSEIHMLEIIGDSDGMSVTDIAKVLQVTKGAVSQRLKQFEFKDLATKIEDPANRSRAIVTLTSKGKIAYFTHKHWHETMDGGFKAFTEGLTDTELKTIERFLDKTKKLLHNMLELE